LEELINNKRRHPIIRGIEQHNNKSQTTFKKLNNIKKGAKQQQMELNNTIRGTKRQNKRSKTTTRGTY
jgi:hypothetical protein